MIDFIERNCFRGGGRGGGAKRQENSPLNERIQEYNKIHIKYKLVNPKHDLYTGNSNTRRIFTHRQPL